ncbi:DUF5606 domain-containing protein [Fulvivirgaceae bacterium BMA10]|uniref:DUF5606 domain-containing protein n=1 Tax=Splendidivirga corallicola TaxID=3051826 RepID=A0ABT8KT53_9BACT|nr:DUF5606 domain-containing protein [Fulvivirgaceae bacterium BMA10]
MELKDIASVSGKGGLFKVIKPTRSGVILESMDEKKSKLVASVNNRISILEEISIYSHTPDGTTPLKDVLVNIHNEFGEDPGIDSGSSSEELKAFLKHILPEYDEERVYVSDIKKVVSWYKIIFKYAPEILQETKNEESQEDETKSES